MLVAVCSKITDLKESGLLPTRLPVRVTSPGTTQIFWQQPSRGVYRLHQPNISVVDLSLVSIKRATSHPSIIQPSDPQPFGTGRWFHGRQFFHRWGGGGAGGCRMTRVHHIQAHLLLCRPVSNRPGPVLVRGPDVGDP